MKRKKDKKARLLTMDELHARPCEVDGRPALFHRWVEEVTALLDVYEIRALVEYPDGTIDEVGPELIQFTDEKEGLA